VRSVLAPVERIRQKARATKYRTTRAAIASGAGSFSIEEIEVGSPVGDEVLVEIRASGLCHTDPPKSRCGRPRDPVR